MRGGGSLVKLSHRRSTCATCIIPYVWLGFMDMIHNTYVVQNVILSGTPQCDIILLNMVSPVNQ